MSDLPAIHCSFAVFFRNQMPGAKLPLRSQAALVSIHTRF
ncbi:uncharacterized protein EbC_40060 [Erwinia billingiae Eb661]|jgi:hypothetical protein|uniref:Uncharacterized protein n=1 Tax=Erwinia billingiae (strain Eb661) TaxID=634500 RepID=D8MXI0_ERWBE|nr:uncharacterized protein EbC_40060 [Erwinia billingiae Eb661]